jgi:geranylgeranyl diphosphate synthase type 3
MNVFVLELLNLHRGQGQDILWRDQLRCPTEEQYRAMVLDKTGGLFRLAVGLMQAVQDENGEGGAIGSSSSEANDSTSTAEQRAESEGSGGVESSVRNFTPLVNKLALYFQIRDDLVNLSSSEYMSSKSYCEDLSEGKFSFPILHAIHSQPNDQQLLSILKQRTESVPSLLEYFLWVPSLRALCGSCVT